MTSKCAGLSRRSVPYEGGADVAQSPTARVLTLRDLQHVASSITVEGSLDVLEGSIMARSESARAPEGAQAALGAGKKCGSFDTRAIAALLPASANTMLVDYRMTDETEASSRVFRGYHPTPAHHHATCDEYLYVLSGRVSWQTWQPSGMCVTTCFSTSAA